MARKRPRSKRPRPKPSRAPAQGTAGSSAPHRIEIVDAARGFAMAMMIAYHFCFDLTYFGWTTWPMLDDERWIAWRTVIVTSFLLLVGVSLALRAERERQVTRAFVARWAQVAAAAALVTAGSLALFPERFIYFGVLHLVALALWLCRRASDGPRRSIALAAVVIAAGLLLSSPAFDVSTVNWVGFATQKPLTEDYVPVFPWIGVVLVGCGLGGLWTERGRRLWPPVRAVWHSLPAWVSHGLATMGRWGLTIYLLHQPVMMGAMTLVRRWT